MVNKTVSQLNAPIFKTSKEMGRMGGLREGGGSVQEEENRWRLWMSGNRID